MNYVVANWKMKMSLDEVEIWTRDFCENFTEGSRARVIIAPTFLHIPYLKARLVAEGLSDEVPLSTQNLSANSKGSHTGEVGAFQVRDFCNFTIVGHSERAEGPALVVEKRDKALEQGLTPIVCFSSPEQAEFFYKKGVILAWEDPDNISSDGEYNEKPLDAVVEAVSEIRELIPEEAELLYGGSVNRENIVNLVDVRGLNGVLVGHASLDPLHFLELVKAYEVS
jgi:triosephosphate isomerase